MVAKGVEGARLGRNGEFLLIGTEFFFFWSDKNLLKLIVVMVAQLREYTKKPPNCTRVWYMIYISIKLFLQKNTILKSILQ